MRSTPLVRFLMFLGAVVCLVLAVLGVFLPGLPTTPFVLLAAWFATRSSPRLLAWLESHRVFGPIVVNWRRHGAVSRRAKWMAAITMALCAVVLWLTATKAWVASVGCVTMVVVLIWLWRRPEPQPDRVSQEK